MRQLKAGFFSLVCLLSLAGILSAAGSDKAVVTASKLRVRSSPDLSAKPLASLPKGAAVLLLQESTSTASIDGKDAHWYRVRTAPPSLEGWAFGGYLRTAPKGGEEGIDPWVYEFCSLNAFGETQDSISKKLGRPLKVQKEDVPNNHDESQIDQLVTLQYKGAVVSLYKTPSKSFLRTLSITKNVDGLNDLAKIGSSPSQVQWLFGPPFGDDPVPLHYECSQVSGGSVEFSFTNDKLEMITWAPYLD